MKNYVRPTVDVVELSVKENMAALPTSIAPVKGTTGTVNVNDTDYTATVYDLTSLSDSTNG